MTSLSKPRMIVVGTDYSELSNLAVERAFELAAEKPGGEVHLLNVVQPVANPYTVLGGPSLADLQQSLIQYSTERLDVFQTKHPSHGASFKIVCHVRQDGAAHELAQLASDLEADIVVVGTHGRRGAERLFLGSVAEAIVRLAPCPVLVVRPKSLPPPAPRIEPACPRCVETRKATGGEQYWCEQHRERHGQRHTYYQRDRVSADSNFPLIGRT